MNTFAAIFSVVLGLIFGSFLNVCISRLPRGESVVAPRSRCPRCRTPISAWDNIPIVSWLLLRGRCRACRVSIPVRYPAVEAATAGLFLLCFLSFGLSVRGCGSAVLCLLLVGLAVTDAETLLVPDALTLRGIALGIIYSSIQQPVAFGRAILLHHRHLCGALLSIGTALAGAALIVLIRWVYWLIRGQEGMGLGDAKLLAMIGAWFGPAETFLVFFLAVIAGAVYGLGLIAVHRAQQTSRYEQSAEQAMRVPLGAFLCLGGLYALFWGEPTLAWYLSLIVK